MTEGPGVPILESMPQDMILSQYKQAIRTLRKEVEAWRKDAERKSQGHNDWKSKVEDAMEETDDIEALDVP